MSGEKCLGTAGKVNEPGPSVGAGPAVSATTASCSASNASYFARRRAARCACATLNEECVLPEEDIWRIRTAGKVNEPEPEMGKPKNHTRLGVVCNLYTRQHPQVNSGDERKQPERYDEYYGYSNISQVA